MDVQRCGGTAFISVILSTDTHRSFLIHTDRVFIIRGGGDDGGLEGIGQGGDFPPLAPQWRCTSSGCSRGHQGPLCAGNHQVASDGTRGLPALREGNGVRRGGVGGAEEKVQEWSSLECSQKRQRARRRGKERGCLKGWQL